MAAPSSAEEVLEVLGIEITSVGDKEIAAKCPFHPDAHPSFSMNVNTHLWICYQCGESGSLEMLVQKVGGPGINPVRMLREVRHQAVAKPKQIESEVPVEISVDPAVIFVRYEEFRCPPAWAREERFLDPEVLEHYGVKWDHGWIIPIWAPEAENRFTDLWGWQFKRLDFVSNYPKAVKKSQTLFGLRELSVSTVVLVESPLDVVRLASAGVAAVAAYGAFVSRAQMKLLEEVAEKVVLALDSDEEGQRQTEQIYSRIAKLVPTVRMSMPVGCKDPGDLSDRQIERLFGDISRRALPLPKRSRRHDARPRRPSVGARSRHGEDHLLHSRNRGTD